MTNWQQVCGDVEVGVIIEICECGLARELGRPHGYRKDEPTRALATIPIAGMPGPSRAYGEIQYGARGGALPLCHNCKALPCDCNEPIWGYWVREPIGTTYFHPEEETHPGWTRSEACERRTGSEIADRRWDTKAASRGPVQRRTDQPHVFAKVEPNADAPLGQIMAAVREAMARAEKGGLIGPAPTPVCGDEPTGPRRRRMWLPDDPTPGSPLDKYLKSTRRVDQIVRNLFAALIVSDPDLSAELERRAEPGRDGYDERRERVIDVMGGFGDKPATMPELRARANRMYVLLTTPVPMTPVIVRCEAPSLSMTSETGGRDRSLTYGHPPRTARAWERLETT